MSVTLKHGMSSSRYIKALAIAKGDPIAAVAYAEGQWYGSSAVMGLKAAVDAMSTGNTGAMVAAPSFIASDFLEFVRPRSLLDRIPGFRQVPLNTRCSNFRATPPDTLCRKVLRCRSRIRPRPHLAPPEKGNRGGDLHRRAVAQLRPIGGSGTWPRAWPRGWRGARSCGVRSRHRGLADLWRDGDCLDRQFAH